MKKKLICAFLALVMLIGVIPGVPLVAKAESNMTASQSLVDLLKAFEGFKATPYPDNKQYSIGYGTWCGDTRDDVPAEYWNGISEEKAEELMRNHMSGDIADLNRFIDKHGLSLTQQQFDALVSFTYNCGEGWMLETDGKFYSAITSGDMGDFLVYAFGLWSKSKDTVSLGHIRRRMIEAQVYLHGIYDNSKWPDNLRYVYLDGNGGTTKYYYQTFDATKLCPFRAEFTAVPKDSEGNNLTFAGWFSQPEGGVEVKNLSSTITNGMVLYAHWKNAAGEIVTIDTDNSAPEDVYVIVPQWWPNTLYEGPGTYYSEVRKTTFEEQLHITKTIVGKDGNKWGYCADGWIPLSDTNYDEVVNSTVEGTWYKVTVDVVNVRAEHSTENNDNIKYTKEFDDRIKIVETYNEMQGESILRIWGKLTDGNWICMKNGEKDYVVVDSNQEDSSGGSQTTPPLGQTITAISLVTAPDRKKYELNDGWVYPDLTGGTIKIHYSPNSYRDKVVNITRSMISGFDDSVEGVQTVTVTCGGHSVTFEVQVVQTIVTSIAVQSAPAKTEYVQNGKETLDLSGGTLLVTYNDGTTAEIPMTGDMVTTFDNTQLGTAKVGLKYEDCTTEFNVTIVEPVLQSVSMQTLPAKVAYLHMLETLDLSGAVLQLNFSGGIVQPVEITPEMVTGFDNTVLGTQTLTVTYGEMTTTFPVEIKKLTVVFKNYDGSIISSAEYAYGESVSAPADPTRPADYRGEYRFAGWDKPVVDCTGNAEYVAVYELMGDINSDGAVNEDDAIYLLWHKFFPEEYNVSAFKDFDGNGEFTEDDAIYLLWYVFFPEEYPLK